MIVTNLPALPVAAAQGEGASRETFIPIVLAGRCPSVSRVARARQPTQLEDAPLINSFCSAVYLVQEIDADI